jgi:hypothetical protein
METPSIIMRQKNYKTKRQENGRIDGGKQKKANHTMRIMYKGNGKSNKGTRNWFRNKITNLSLGTQFLYLFKWLLLHVIEFS